MNSSVLHIGIIEQLPRLGYSPNSSKMKKSCFWDIVRQANKLTKEVEERWDELSEEDREALQNLALAALGVCECKSEEKLSWRQHFLKWKVKLDFFVATFTARLDVEALLEAGLAVSRLIDAIMEAVEREEQEVTALFLDRLLEDVEANPSKLVPYTEEMDAELEKLLAGVDLN